MKCFKKFSTLFFEYVDGIRSFIFQQEIELQSVTTALRFRLFPSIGSLKHTVIAEKKKRSLF